MVVGVFTSSASGEFAGRGDPLLLCGLYSLKIAGSTYPPYEGYALTETTIYSLQPLHDHHDNTCACWLVRILHLPEGSNYITYRPASWGGSKDESENKSNNNMNAILKDLTCCRLDEFKEENPYKWPWPKAINLLDFRVHEICNDYRLDLSGWQIHHSFPVAVSSGFDKIFSRTGGGGGYDDQKKTGTTFAVMAKDFEGYGHGLVVWRMGDDKWTPIFDPNTPAQKNFTMFLYSAGNAKFYVFNCQGYTFTFDPASPDPLMKRTQVAPGPQNHHHFCCASFDDNYKLEKVLEVPGSSIILGVFWQDKRFDIQVEKLDEEKQQWIKADGDELKDRVALFGPNFSPLYSFTCCAKYLPGYKPNCIYFDKAIYPHRQPPPKPACGHRGSQLVVFEMENGHATELCDQYGCSPILWPPPLGSPGLQPNNWIGKEHKTFLFANLTKCLTLAAGSFYPAQPW
ncbi:hypothetical protein Tsubulata_025851 [Turnera subulata]|uniref:KIB1-4 beta-propeller domain-containing protein n=1 Tax=Turnera subulata TaxID=218843 RepID=A0A9Q0J3U2_9ROSI|nr:hypothetical protein Tsubulata_025851 [Turnera subulata]